MQFELTRMEFLAGLLGSDWKAPRIGDTPGGSKGIGEFCKGRNVDECRKLFGDALKDCCATCPD